MTADSAAATDKGVGMAMLFGALALLGALAMYVFPETLNAAYGFAAAMVFGSILIGLLHFYGN
ncbi:hypothetical protein [Haladaptatus sp. DYSN1]|uniref:DUF7525 family protein n=1 Tax=unclassified Haladaptatus TaxID=2622732 RepID=UPI002406B87A|nr:hypothetical protein [Haladaptatus sp. DYSN1]